MRASFSSVTSEYTLVGSRDVDEQLALIQKVVGSNKHGSVRGEGMQPLAFETTVAWHAGANVKGCTPASATEPCLADPTAFFVVANCSSATFDYIRVDSKDTEERLMTIEKVGGLNKHGSVGGAGMQPLTFTPAGVASGVDQRPLCSVIPC